MLRMSLPVETPSTVQPSDRRRELIRPTLTRRVKWRLEAMGYAMFETALGGLPLSWVARVGRGLGALAHVFLSGRRRTVMRNLRIAFAGEKTSQELSALTSEVFRRSGANLLSSLRTVKLKDAQLTTVVDLCDEAIFHEAVARGRGVVMVLAHMGNWEALAQWFPRLLPPGVAGATVYRPLNNPIMNRRVATTRRRRGVSLFSKDDNPLGMASFLRRGGVLGVLSDQRAGSIGELVPFFGRLTSCTPIPAILARRTGAAVVGISLRTVATGRWELRFHALTEASPSTVNVMGLVERMMRVSPADVFWLQERWKISSSKPHRQNGKVARGEIVPPTKRRRALLWATEGGVSPSAPVAVPADVDYEVAMPGSSVVEGGLRSHRYEGGSIHDFLRQVDAASDQPLDYVVGGGSHAADVARACDRLGFGWLEAGA
jgi:KDO2-lipid IV(A) lauroyltransferase